MKNLFLFAFVLSFINVFSQNTLVYRFNNSFTPEANNGPILSPIGDGTFVMDTIPDYETNQMVYSFEKNSGFAYYDTAFNYLSSGSYTIELYFKMSELNSWKRVIDFKNRTTDWGCYVFNGQLNFYSIAYSGGAPFTANEYSHYVITRNGETKEVKLYGDGDEYITFIDNNNYAVYEENKKIVFFQDDLIVPNEASDGHISLLRIYDIPLDSNEVKEKFNKLIEVITSAQKPLSIKDAHLNVFPNPSADRINILSNEEIRNGNLFVYTITGALIHQENNLNGKQIEIEVQHLKTGMYILVFKDQEKEFKSRFIKN
jgi:hypothetical protein